MSALAQRSVDAACVTQHHTHTARHTLHIHTHAIRSVRIHSITLHANAHTDARARGNTKFAEFCRNPATPFLVGLKLLILVALEPLVVNVLAPPPVPVPPFAASGLGELRKAYVAFTKQLPVMFGKVVADSWEASALEAIMDFSPRGVPETIVHVRLELCAAWEEAYAKFAPKLTHTQHCSWTHWTRRRTTEQGAA